MCPVSVTTLADGSRAYVASYQVSALSCLANQPCSITSQVTVINASSNSISSVIPLGTVSVDTANDTGCNPATSTHPTRFRLSAASSGDSSRVYVANCDAGSTAIIHTSDDQLVLDLPAPLSDFPPVMTTVNITAATQSGSNTTYNYALTTGPDLQVGMSIVIAGMTDPGNNGTFAIAALGSGAFTVGNGSGVTASSQRGTGTVAMPPPQNPAFILAGP